MYLSYHATACGKRWAVDGVFLASPFSLGSLLQLPGGQIEEALRALKTDSAAAGNLLAPIEDAQEVWASGVTYLRSREARMHESEVEDVYDKVYDAVRPELFFKANGWRVVGPEQAIRVRKDSGWDVPEPELTLVINRHGDIIGYTVGNDVSSRAIEGENPLYLPQAKIFDGSCALGPGIVISDADSMSELAISMEIKRDADPVFRGDTSIAQLKRPLQELADYLLLELAHPNGVFLMTGAGIVPADDFSLRPGDKVSIRIADLTLVNPVAS